MVLVGPQVRHSAHLIHLTVKDRIVHLAPTISDASVDPDVARLAVDLPTQCSEVVRGSRQSASAGAPRPQAVLRCQELPQPDALGSRRACRRSRNRRRRRGRSSRRRRFRCRGRCRSRRGRCRSHGLRRCNHRLHRCSRWTHPRRFRRRVPRLFVRFGLRFRRCFRVRYSLKMFAHFLRNIRGYRARVRLLFRDAVSGQQVDNGFRLDLQLASQLVNSDLVYV